MTKQEIGRILREARERKGLTRAEVGKRFDKTDKAVGHWETGQSSPDANILFELCDLYGISIDDHFGRKRHTMEITTVESEVLAMYRLLDDHGKSVVDTVMRFEYDRCKAAPERIVRLCRFTSPSAAGAPNPAEGDYEYVDYPYNDATVRADFAVGIQGESMLPALEDGCTVFVSTEERISDGDIVIAWLEGEGMVCKRVMMDGERLKMLESINPDFDSYAGYDLQGVRIFGKVVGSDM